MLDVDVFFCLFVFSMKWNISPQAIFKDPFRRGNNILVSPVFIIFFGLDSIYHGIGILNLDDWLCLGHVRYLHTSW